MLCYVPVVFICGTGATGVATAVVAGAGLALLPDDLREHLMLGDTGANVLGAVLGLAVVLEAAPATRVVVAIVLFVANLASEFVSFSGVIAACRRCARSTTSVGPVRREAVHRVARALARRCRRVRRSARRTRPPASAATDPPPIRRVFVFSMPGVTWSELDTVDLPNLEGFLAGSALASLAPARVVAHRPGAADAYVTFGAGTRGVGLPGVDGDQFDAEEMVGDVTAGEVFQRRTGRDPKSGIVSLGFPSLRRENAALPYDIELGAVADQLAQHDVDRAVIANADGVDGPGSDDRHREAALALVDGTGVVENGQVGNVLLTPDPAAPFGVKLDTEPRGRRVRQGVGQGRQTRRRARRGIGPRPAPALHAVHHRGAVRLAAYHRAPRRRRDVRAVARAGRSRPRRGHGRRAVRGPAQADRDRLAHTGFEPGLHPHRVFAARRCRDPRSTSDRRCSTCSASTSPTRWKVARTRSCRRTRPSRLAPNSSSRRHRDRRGAASDWPR